MNFSPKNDESPLSASGGVDTVAASDRDPYEALDDLMVVVEAFCPIWPSRPPMKSGQFKL
jgi:hypothetical protein